MFRQKLLQNLPSVLYQYRLSEIALAFYLEHYGAIGYIKWPLSVYRLHSGGVWSGSKPIEQLLQHKHVMLTTQAVCLQKYKPAIMKDIEHTDEKIRALQERALLPKKGGVKQFFKKVIAVFSKKKISFLFF